MKKRKKDSDDNVYALVSSLKKRGKIYPAINQFTIRAYIDSTKGHWQDLSRALPARVEKEWDEWEDIRETTHYPSSEDEI